MKQQALRAEAAEPFAPGGGKGKTELAPLTPEAVVRAGRFREVIEHALRRLGGGGRLAVHRELAETLMVSTSMVTRYRSGMDPYTIATGVMGRLAEAAGLHVGSLYAWIAEGEPAARELERQLVQKPKAFSELELARELVAMLESNPLLAPATSSEPDYALLDSRLQVAAEKSTFARWSKNVPGGKEAIQAVADRAPLSEQDWDALSLLLADNEPGFIERHSRMAEAAPGPEPGRART